MTQFVRVGAINDFDESVLYDRKVGDRRIAVVRAGERFYALSSVCPHYGFSITPGCVEAGTITCPVHGAVFNVDDGEPTAGPAAGPLDVYAVRVEGDDVFVSETPTGVPN